MDTCMTSFDTDAREWASRILTLTVTTPMQIGRRKMPIWVKAMKKLFHFNSSFTRKKAMQICSIYTAPLLRNSDQN